MWSAWPERWLLYLGGRSVAVRRERDAVTSARRWPEPVPLTEQLDQAGRWLSQVGGSSRTRKVFKVQLGLPHCRPLATKAPRGVAKADEQAKWVQSEASNLWNQSSEAVECHPVHDLDGLWACARASEIATLTTWAQAQGIVLGSVQPVWATATQCRSANAKDILALQLDEPGGSCLVGRLANGIAIAASAIAGNDEDRRATLRRHAISMALPPDSLVHLGFDPSDARDPSEPSSTEESLPQVWKGQWRVVADAIVPEASP